MRKPRKITISRDGVSLNGMEIPGVVSADVMNINPGLSGAMQVTLVVSVTEVDVQYSQIPAQKMETAYTAGTACI